MAKNLKPNDLTRHIENFKRFHNITGSFGLEFKLNPDMALLVKYNKQWFRLSQVKDVNKYYSKSILERKYGVGLLRALKLQKVK